jgi:ABC-type transport system substrate-binding protein
MKTNNMKIRYFFFVCLLVFACKNNQKKLLPNIINVRLEGELNQLNPILTTKAFCKQVEGQLFMPLLGYDAETLELYPVLATSRPTIQVITEGAFVGGRKYIFEIRPEAKWDDGQAVVADDFVFTLKAFLHPEIGHPGLRSFLSFIKSITIDPSNAKKFTVLTDVSINLAEEVIGMMAVYPKHIYDPTGILENYSIDIFTNRDIIRDKVESDSLLHQFAERFKQSGFSTTSGQVNGCGPYAIAEWIPGQRIILKKKDHWWAACLGESNPAFKYYPDELVYHFMEENITLATLLKEQKIDVSAAIDPLIFDELKKSEFIRESYNFFTPVSSAYYFISFNTKNPKLADKQTRKAISHLLNIEETIRIAMNGYATRTVGPILPVKPYYNKELKPIGFSIEKAKVLLKAAGWTDQDQNGILEREIDGTLTDLSIKYKYTSNNTVAEKVGFLLKDNAAKAGIEVILTPLANDKLIEDTRSRDFELYCSQWSQPPGLDDLSGIWHTESDTPRGFNKAGFGNAKTDALIEAINIVLDEEKRTEMYDEIQQIIYEEQPYVFLFVPTERIIIHKRFDAKTTNLRPGYFENTFRMRE